VKSYTTLIKGARLVVETCFAVKAGDAVLVICDEDHRREAEAMAGVAVSLGAYPVIADVSHHVSAALASMKVPMEPARNLAAAMEGSDVVIITTNLEWANRFAHVNPVAASVKKGAKIGSVEEGMAQWDLTKAEIDETVARAEKLMAALDGVEWVRVTNPAGTDVKVCIKGRPPLKVVPIKGAGEMMGPVPLWGEVAYAAVEDKTEGVIVVDGIMLGVGVFGSLSEPIRWVIRDGRAVEIAGGAEAERLRAVVAGSDENADVVAEFAMGTSTKSPTGSASEKGLLGTVHFALGDNAHCYPGGQSHSSLHLDGCLRHISVEAEGRPLIRDGALVV
jgi:leucyl aminopeptidase (aminopeptidase T)